MFLTLEQLDQFGSLDDLPFSLDNNWTDEGICGPFTLEGLDQFNTNLDELAFSLDSEVWNTACIKLERSGAFQGVGTLVAAVEDFQFIQAAFSGTGELASSAQAEKTVAGSISGSGTLSATAQRQKEVSADIVGTGSLVADAQVAPAIEISGSITGTGTLTASGSQTKAASAQILGQGTLVSGANYETQASANIQGQAELSAVFTKIIVGNPSQITGRASVSCTLYKFGEEWSVVPDEANAWTVISAESNTWTEIPAGNNQWQLRA